MRKGLYNKLFFGGILYTIEEPNVSSLLGQAPISEVIDVPCSSWGPTYSLWVFHKSYSWMDFHQISRICMPLKDLELIRFWGIWCKNHSEAFDDFEVLQFVDVPQAYKCSGYVNCKKIKSLYGFGRHLQIIIANLPCQCFVYLPAGVPAFCGWLFLYSLNRKRNKIE